MKSNTGRQRSLDQVRTKKLQSLSTAMSRDANISRSGYFTRLTMLTVRSSSCSEAWRSARDDRFTVKSTLITKKKISRDQRLANAPQWYSTERGGFELRTSWLGSIHPSASAAETQSRPSTSQARLVGLFARTRMCMTPDSWTAIFTGLLVVVTGLAVFFGKRAADAALSMLQLESEPALVFSVTSAPPNRTFHRRPIGNGRELYYALDPNEWYTIASEVDDDGNKSLSFHRAIGGELDKAQPTPPGTYIEIKNVGRSPAIGVTITINVEAESLSMASGEPEPETIEGRANVVVHAIGPNSSEYIGIANTLAVPVRLFPDTWGTRALLNDPERKTRGKVKTARIAVLSMVFMFNPSK